MNDTFFLRDYISPNNDFTLGWDRILFLSFFFPSVIKYFFFFFYFEKGVTSDFD